MGDGMGMAWRVGVVWASDGDGQSCSDKVAWVAGMAKGGASENHAAWALLHGWHGRRRKKVSRRGEANRLGPLVGERGREVRGVGWRGEFGQGVGPSMQEKGNRPDRFDPKQKDGFKYIFDFQKIPQIKWFFRK